MKFTASILLLLITISTMAQKRLSQTYDASGIEELYINSNEIFQINISAIETEQITINTVIDGEVFASTLLNSVIEQKTLKITTGNTPDYVPFNDKLSAHKVIAITLEVSIPLGTDLSIYSTLANVATDGSFGEVRVDLDRGRFVGTTFRFRESANINTLDGSITLHTAQARLSVQSRRGTIEIPDKMTAGPVLNVKSIDGNITVVKSL